MRTAALLLAVVGTTLAAQCGQTPVKPNLGTPTSTRPIVGGTLAVPYSWPWQIVWCNSGWFGGCDLECGGTVIDTNWVMTAGHCVEDDLNPRSYKVKAGIESEDQTTESGEQVVDVKAIFLHPNFHDDDVPDHDIALIQLASPLTFTDHVQPVCLPSTDAGVLQPPNGGYVTGWGTTEEEGDISLKLRQLKVPFVDMTSCKRDYSGLIQDDVMLCAGREGGDTCQGDSGGPLVVQDKNGTWFQYGITSWGYGCAERNEPGIYSRVTAYCDFIQQTTGVSCLQPNN